MKLVIKNNTEELNEILTKYKEILEMSSCQMIRAMTVQFEINELEVACMISPSDGNLRQLDILRKVLTRLESRVKLELVA